MQSTLAKNLADHVSRKTGGNIEKITSTSAMEVDFSAFGAKEIRDIMKSKAHCLRAGFSINHIIINTLNEIRDHYIHRVGLTTYLSQMLGPVGNAPIQDCTLYDENGRRIQLHLNGDYNQAVQRFIAKQFRWNNLPAKVEVRTKLKPQIEIRYL